MSMIDMARINASLRMLVVLIGFAAVVLLLIESGRPVAHGRSALRFSAAIVALPRPLSPGLH